MLIAPIMSLLFAVPMQSPSPAAGHWKGTIAVPGAGLGIICDLSADEKGAWSGKLAIPAQSLKDFPLGNVTVVGGAVSFQMPGIPGSPMFKGTLTQDGTAITGDFTQSGMSFPFKLEKKTGLAAATLVRPQEPKPPFPYREEDVVYENSKDSVKLAATLTLPESKTPVPAVLLIQGSGPHDRNEALFGHKPFWVLADYLTRRGLAVLRADRRGIGKSTGSYAKATSEDFASDAAAAVEFLKTRKEVDPKRIGLIGHSEGGLIAPMVASREPGLAFMVLMAGPGMTGEQNLYAQSDLLIKAAGGSDAKAERNKAIQRATFAIVKSEPDPAVVEKRIKEEVSKLLADLPEEERKTIQMIAESQAKWVASPWFRFFLTYDPVPALQKLRCPVLAVNGELDKQVAAKENLGLIERALAAGGNKDYRTLALPKLNHLFQTAQTGSVSEYATIEETISPGALKVIGGWIEERTAAQQQSK